MTWKTGVGVGALAIGALILAWIALGGTHTGDVDDRERANLQTADLKDRTKAWTKAQKGKAGALVEGTVAEEAPIPLDDDPRINVVTDTCRKFIKLKARNVPMDVQLDMIRDGGTYFSEDDLQCMSVGGAKPAIVDMAHRKKQY